MNGQPRLAFRRPQSTRRNRADRAAAEPSRRIRHARVKASIDLAVPGRPIGPWVAEDRSAAGVRDPTGPEELPRRIRGLPTRRWSPRTGLTLWTSWEPLPPRARWSFSSAVPPACHKQRSPAVSSGQSRSLHAGRWAGRTCLTWGGGGGRNCMVRKRSCRIGRLSLLTLDHSPGGCVDGRSHRNAVVGCIVWSTTASSSADRVSRSTCSRRRAPNASIVLAASYLRRLNRRSTTA